MSSDTSSKNIIQKYIKTFADFNVDPCEDFYAHVCPRGTPGMFLAKVNTLKNQIEQKMLAKRPSIKAIVQATEQNVADLEKLINSGELSELCDKNAAIVKTFVRPLIRVTNMETLNLFKQMNCQEVIQLLQDPMEDEETNPLFLYKTARDLFTEAIQSSLAAKYVNKIDEKVKKLFERLRYGVEKAIHKTPWTNRNGAVELYTVALNNIKFATFSNAMNNTRNAYLAYQSNYNACLKKLSLQFSNSLVTIVCDVVGIAYGSLELKKPIPGVPEGLRDRVYQDNLEQSNTNDDTIYLSNDFLLLADTDYLSDLYGGIGFSLTHEIMHTFVFDDDDRMNNNPLIPLWTNSSGCVEKQALKTCKTFPTVKCNTRHTFEEDAADLTAYRIVWDLYQRELMKRKKKVENYEALDNKQLFFYGAAVMFCQENGMDSDPLYFNAHSNNYQRVNSLMSQMDHFANAFQCESTDKMVMNKAEHCELYGSKANRKHHQLNF